MVTVFAGLALVLLLLILLGLGIVAVLLVMGLLTRGSRPAREERAVLAARFGGAFVGLIGAVVFAGLPRVLGFDLRLGRGAMLAPIVFGLILLCGVIAGELIARAPAPSGTRSASLAPRRVIDYVPAAYGYSLALVSVGVLLLLATTTATAAADDLGRAGRVLRNVCSNTITSSHGPYPGSFYAVPLVLGLILAFALAAYAARVAVLRPRGDLSRLGADYLRKRSVAAVVGALGLAICGPTLGVAIVSASSLLSNTCPTGWQRSAGILSILLALGSLIVMVWSVAVIVYAGVFAGRPHNGVPHEAAPSA
ncbi:MAG: hypothetical protein V9F00_05325 [Nocardioides sp.]